MLLCECFYTAGLIHCCRVRESFQTISCPGRWQFFRQLACSPQAVLPDAARLLRVEDPLRIYVIYSAAYSTAPAQPRPAAYRLKLKASITCSSANKPESLRGKPNCQNSSFSFACTRGTSSYVIQIAHFLDPREPCLTRLSSSMRKSLSAGNTGTGAGVTDRLIFEHLTTSFLFTCCRPGQVLCCVPVPGTFP